MVSKVSLRILSSGQHSFQVQLSLAYIIFNRMG